MKTLYFEGAGLIDTAISKPFINNCRIRTAFHLKDGRAVYLEILGGEWGKYIPSVRERQYTGFVETCHYITDDIPNDDSNNHRIRLANRNNGSVGNSMYFEFTEDAVLRFVNSLGADFDAIMVLPDLGGYRVFPSQVSGKGPNSYYYGDEFRFAPELTARREAGHRHYHEVEQAEGKKYPNFSMWVDEFDPGLLHLLRHFAGDFRTAHNRHWTIRVDGSADLDEILATARETTLGRFGC